MAGLVAVLGFALLAAMAWESVANTRDAAQQSIDETLNRATERLQILARAVEMTGQSARRAALTSGVTWDTLQPTLESTLAAFEQRPELSYVGIALPDGGEYGNLERVADGSVLMSLVPAHGAGDPVINILALTDHGFVPRERRAANGYDPRTRPFYAAGLAASPGGIWIPAYPWVLRSGTGTQPLWGLTFVQAIHDDAGRLLGVLDVDLDLPALKAFVQSLNDDYHARIQVVELGPAARLIAGPAIDREPQPLPAGLAPLAAARTAYTGRMRLDGERRWVAARRLDLRGVSWLVIASRPAPFITTPLRHQLYEVLGMGLALVLVLTLASIRMAHRFGQPLAELEQRAAVLADRGPEALDLGHTAGVSGGFRETQLLREAFDRMAAAVQQRKRELLELNAELEQRVADRTRELQTLNRELESFSHSVSHDLRAPLRGIAGFTQILARDHAQALDARARGYLDRVVAATQRMGELIDDLINLSRVSREPMQRSPVDLSALARAILADLRQADPARQVEVRIDPGLSAEGDPRLLRVMLENLLGNAWKFTTGTPGARIDFTASDAGGGPGFAVRDNGAGFDMRYAAKLFGAFQRLHRATDFPGTGIGLATVQRIINRHGGRITAHGEPGRGATFWFSLGKPTT